MPILTLLVFLPLSGRTTAISIPVVIATRPFSASQVHDKNWSDTKRLTAHRPCLHIRLHAKIVLNRYQTPNRLGPKTCRESIIAHQQTKRYWKRFWHTAIGAQLFMASYIVSVTSANGKPCRTDGTLGRRAILNRLPKRPQGAKGHWWDPWGLFRGRSEWIPTLHW